MRRAFRSRAAGCGCSTCRRAHSGRNVVKDLGIPGGSSDPATFGIAVFRNQTISRPSPTRPCCRRHSAITHGHCRIRSRLTRGRHSFESGSAMEPLSADLSAERLSARPVISSTASIRTIRRIRAPAGDAFADFLLGYAQSTRRTLGAAQAYLRPEQHRRCFCRTSGG